MSAFSDNELTFLQDGPKLARIATVDPSGDPHVVPTGWSYNPEHGSIDIGGIELARTQKYRNAARTGRAAVVIDDVQPPWQPRAVFVRGSAETHDELIRIRCERIISWGIESDQIGERSSRDVS